MTIENRVVHLESTFPATAHWIALRDFACEFGWSELKISEAKETLRHLNHET